MIAMFKAAFSTGPVGIGDAIGYTNATRARAVCQSIPNHNSAQFRPFQNGATFGFDTCYAIGSQHRRCPGVPTKTRLETRMKKCKPQFMFRPHQWAHPPPGQAVDAARLHGVGVRAETDPVPVLF